MTEEKTSVISSETFKGKLRAADDAPPAIVILVGPAGYVGKQWLLTKDDHTLGRAPETDISILDSSLSRTHAKIVISNLEVHIMDLGSTNKTQVNGHVLAPMSAKRLSNNDQIKAGNVIFKFLEKGNVESITNQQIFEKAQRDALTGAFNKGALLEKGPEAIKRAEVLNEHLSAIVFDLDFFKKVNTDFGHPGGDYVLKELGQIMSSKLVRSNDVFARYGGEEFVLILAGTSVPTASDIAERIRQTIESSEFIYEGRRIPVTVSLGVAGKQPTEVTWESLFQRADTALYTSKQTGRNRVTIAS